MARWTVAADNLFDLRIGKQVTKPLQPDYFMIEGVHGQHFTRSVNCTNCRSLTHVKPPRWRGNGPNSL